MNHHKQSESEWRKKERQHFFCSFSPIVRRARGEWARDCKSAKLKLYECAPRAMTKWSRKDNDERWMKNKNKIKSKETQATKWKENVNAWRVDNGDIFHVDRAHLFFLLLASFVQRQFSFKQRVFYDPGLLLLLYCKFCAMQDKDDL